MNRGISLVSIIVAITLTIILTTTVVISVVNVSNNSKKLRFGTEIAYINELVYNYNISNNKKYPVTSNNIILNVGNLDSDILKQFEGEDVINNTIVLTEIDFSILGNPEIKYGKKSENNDVYAISQKTGKVYYAKGLNVAKNTYFELTDDIKKIINYVEIEQNISNDGIVIEPSTKEWINKNINALVKVPIRYQSITVKVEQNGIIINNINLKESDINYSIFDISGVNGNYDIIVSYIKNGDSKTRKFSINNFDNIVPTFDLSNTTKLEENGNSSSYIIVNNIKTGVSGIKSIKYENELINESSVKSYFDSNGINVLNNIIVLDKKIKNITVFIEDKAGNFSYKYLSINT